MSADVRLTRRLLIGGLAALAIALAGAAPAQADPSWTMPNLVGTDLQGLTGQGRAQIVDRNWIVCSSTPTPGTAFTATTAINFGVVKDTEVCPR